MASDRLTPIRPVEISAIPAESEPVHIHRKRLIQDMSADESNKFEAGQPPSQDNCDDKPLQTDPSTSIASTKRFAGQTVAPFLARHIPEQYAPLGITPQPPTSRKDPNTKYCYRHRPDSKCRRTADEPTMENLQRVRDIQVWLLSIVLTDT
jgi:hypothetical protein